MNEISQKSQLAAILPARMTQSDGPARDQTPKALAAGDRSKCKGRFTDNVGYTALMEEDEEKVLHIHRVNRMIHRQKIDAVVHNFNKRYILEE